jgi:diacylglycerol kinase family enzyme
MLSKPGRLSRHRHIHPFSGIDRVAVRSLDDRPLPIQVDGDFIGTAPEVEFAVCPRALTVVA